MGSQRTTSGAAEIGEIVDLVSAIERRLSARVAAVVEPEGCSLGCWRALRLLADGAGHSMSELVAQTLLAPPTATRLVDGMVADNLAYRTVDQADRRRVLVHATARGSVLHQRLAARVEAAAQDILPALPDDEVLERLRALAGL